MLSYRNRPLSTVTYRDIPPIYSQRMAVETTGKNHVNTWHIRVHTVYIHVHTLYMATTYFMNVPLQYLPLLTRQYHLWHRYVQCYRTGIHHCVHTGINLLEPFLECMYLSEQAMYRMANSCMIALYIASWRRYRRVCSSGKYHSWTCI